MPPKQSVTNTRHAPQEVARAVPRTPLSAAFVWPFITISPLCCRQPLYFAKYIANHVSRFTFHSSHTHPVFRLPPPVNLCSNLSAPVKLPIVAGYNNPRSFWSAGGRAVVFLLAASSIACLLCDFYQLCPMRRFTLFIFL